jgi:hypothetical protein
MFRIVSLQHSHYQAGRIIHFLSHRATGGAFAALVAFIYDNTGFQP